MQLQEANSLNLLVKQKIIDLLRSEGYATYANRFKKLNFVVAEFYKGTYCPVAFMSPTDMVIVVNPALIVDMMENGPIFKQLSVLVRHELLHFLLCHEKRFLDYLKKVDPNFAQTYKRVDMHTIANFAMDYELGNYGYDDYDKSVVKNMTINGRVVGGLLAEDVTNSTASVYGRGIKGVETYHGAQFNGWENKSMEEMFQMLRDEHDKLLQADPSKDYRNKNKLKIKGTTHSQEYQDAYNKVMQTYNSAQYSDAEIEDLLKQVQAGKELF